MLIVFGILLVLACVVVPNMGAAPDRRGQCADCADPARCELDGVVLCEPCAVRRERTRPWP